MTEIIYEPTEPGFGVTEPGVHGPRPQSYAAPWPGLGRHCLSDKPACLTVI